MALQQRNPTVGKASLQLGQAGASPGGPILAGLRGRLRITLGPGETLLNQWVANDDGDFLNLNVEEDPATGDVLADVVFGQDTFYGRNVLEWLTNRGLSNRQFYVAALPSSGALYLDGQEAQSATSRAVVYVDASTTNPMARCASIAVNVLPTLTDEFFAQHQYPANRYANTRREWGGAATAEVFVDGTVEVAEQDVADLCNLWMAGLTSGRHEVVVRLRAEEGSAWYVDVIGFFFARQIPTT